MWSGLAPGVRIVFPVSDVQTNRRSQGHSGHVGRAPAPNFQIVHFTTHCADPRKEISRPMMVMEALKGYIGFAGMGFL
jgi:hypothetical protein